MPIMKKLVMIRVAIPRLVVGVPMKYLMKDVKVREGRGPLVPFIFLNYTAITFGKLSR